MGAPELPAIAIPGQTLANTTTYISGPGTYTRDKVICASIPGPVIIQHSNTGPKGKQIKTITIGRSAASPSNRPTSVQPEGLSLLGSTNKRIPLKFNTLPTVGSIVLGRVTRVQKRQATITILLVLSDLQHQTDALSDTDISSILASANMNTTTDPLNADELRPQALIRKEDVRAVEKDRVVMEDAFRVGDIVRAVIVSVGDQVAYYASTAGNELGVLMARSGLVEGNATDGFGGNMMFPVSWKEMRDPVTGRSETRKVAKPF